MNMMVPWPWQRTEKAEKTKAGILERVMETCLKGKRKKPL